MPGMYPYSSMPTGLLSFDTGGSVVPNVGSTIDFTGSGTDPNAPVPVPGMPGYFWVPNPLTGVPTLVHDTTGTTGRTSTGGSTAQPNYHLSPQELQLEYDKLYQDSLKAGMTEEDARRQALAGLLENQRTEQVNLANTYGNIADKAAAFAQKPTDAVADLMYRNAMYGSGQGGTPYGSTNNASMTQMQGALSDKFQQMFGPAAGALSQAQNFLTAPIPSDYLSPTARQGMGQSPNMPIPTPQFTGGAPSATANPNNPAPGAAQGGSITGSFMGVPLASGWGFAQGGSASVQPYGLSNATGAPNTQAGLTGAADGALVSFQPVSMAGGGLLDLMMRNYNQPASGTPSLDVNRDGRINILDIARTVNAMRANRSLPGQAAPTTLGTPPAMGKTYGGTGFTGFNASPTGTMAPRTAPSMGSPYGGTNFASPRPTTLGSPTPTSPGTSFGGVSFAPGGSVGAVEGFSNFGTVSSSGGMGYASGGRVGVRPPPMPAEGGLSLNLSEPAKIVGIHSGHVYATLAEPRPDGTPRPERLEIKPLKSEVQKDKEYAKAQGESTLSPQQTLATGGQQQPSAPGNPQGQMAGGQMTGMNAYAQGGDITFGQTPSDFYGALRQQLSNMGAQTQPGQTLPDPRMLSGDFYTNYSRADPQLQGEIESGYNAQFPNIDFQHTLQQFSPVQPQQSFFRPMVSFS